MLAANHSGIGFLSNKRSERMRIFVIHSGSPFHQAICSTTPRLMPFSGVKVCSTPHPRPYLLRSRSKEVMLSGLLGNQNRMQLGVQPPG